MNSQLIRAAILAVAISLALVSCGKETSESDDALEPLGLLPQPLHATLHAAAEAGDVYDVARHISLAVSAAGAVYGRTPLHEAALRGDVPLIEVLLAYGAVPGLLDKEGRTPASTARAQFHGPAATLLSEPGPGPEDLAIAGAMAGPPLCSPQMLPSELLKKRPINGTLVQAARAGDVYDVLRHIQAVVSRVYPPKSGRQPLHAAAAGGCVATVELLLHCGADPIAKNMDRRTALRVATERGFLEVAEVLMDYKLDGPIRVLSKAISLNRPDVVARLLDSDPSLVNVTDFTGTPMLFMATMAGHADIVEILLKHGAQANMIHAKLLGRTPLLMAASTADLPVVKLLLEHGADADYRDQTRYSALDVAFARENLALCDLLLEHGATIDALGPQGLAPIHIVARDGRRDLVEWLLARGARLSVGDKSHRVPLYWAANKGHRELAAFLIDQGAWVVNGQRRPRDPHGRQQPRSDFPPLHGAIANRDYGMVKFLISKGARVRRPGPGGMTAVHTAAQSGLLEFVEYAAGLELPLDTATEQGLTPLHVAVSSLSADTRKVVAYLIKKGVRLEAKTENGETPLALAVAEYNVSGAKLLIENGADVHSRDFDGNTLLHRSVKVSSGIVLAQILLDAGADVNATGNDGATPLNLACTKNYEAFVDLFLKHEADVLATDGQGLMPLHAAAAVNGVPIAKTLLAAGASVNVTDARGMTPLHIATAKGHYHMTRKLLSWGAGVNAADNSGNTPLHHGIQGMGKKVVRVLLERGANPHLRNKKGRRAEDLAYDVRNMRDFKLIQKFVEARKEAAIK